MAEVNIQPDDQTVFDRLKSTGRITHGLRRVMTQQWNKCTACGHFVLKGRPAFAGYSAYGTPLLVGACCADQIVELATPVYPTGTLNLSIDDSQQVWRYMDFAKFVAMLQQGGIYFPRVDKLEDRFEGAVGLARREPDWDCFYLDFFRTAIMSPLPCDPQPDFSSEHIESEAGRLLQQFKAVSSLARSFLVSCWHANSVESEALWRLYCPPPTPGVAIRTTVGRLWDATAQDASAVVGRVHYLDFRRTFARHGYERVFCKRLSLSHEREVRVIQRNDPECPVVGRTLACDLNALIEEVIISPFAPLWFVEVVSSVIDRFSYAFEVRQSELLDEPFY
jgi:hypothetical protein